MTFNPIDIDIYSEVVPYTRMTQRGKYVKPDAIRYLQAQKDIKTLMMLAKRNLECYEDYYVPEKTAFVVGVQFYNPKLHYCDLDNLCKAILDAGQGVLYKDDRYCDQIIAIREKCEGEPHVRLQIMPMGDWETK